MKTILIIIAILFIIGCDRTQQKCQDEIEDIIYHYGQPDKIIRTSTVNIQTATYQYMSLGFEYVFTFGTMNDECNVTIRHFPRQP